METNKKHTENALKQALRRNKSGSAENMGAFTLPANCDEMDYSAARAYFSMPRILPLIQA